MSARFFCDNCGIEVRRNSSRCTGCGRYFAFVRCPQCNYTGEESRFAGGCPACGYCTADQDRAPSGKTLSGKTKRKPYLITAKLPLWVYILAVFGLIGVILVLYYTVQ